MSHIPKALCLRLCPSPRSFIFILPPLIVLSISFYRSHCLCDCCPVSGREGQQRGRPREGRRERRKEGGMSFTDAPPGCTHSSRAVHPVLSSPPPPRLTQHAARTHASHTLKHTPPPSLLPQRCPLFLQLTPYWAGNGDFFFLSFFLAFFFPSFCLFIIVSSCTLLPAQQELFPILPGRWGTKWF